MEKTIDNGNFTINVCNKCKHLDFRTKKCIADEHDPILLNTYTTSNGFVHVLKPSGCSDEQDDKT